MSNIAYKFLIELGVENYTQRHIRVIDAELKSPQPDAKTLLDKLGSWNENDLAITEKFLNDIV